MRPVTFSSPAVSPCATQSHGGIARWSTRLGSQTPLRNVGSFPPEEGHGAAPGRTGRTWEKGTGREDTLAEGRVGPRVWN